MSNDKQTKLPDIGWSRFSQFKQFLPFSRETFRKLVRDKKAPQPQRMGSRCTMYSNEELNKFLANPLNYETH
jgi:predicted DNA-binding transcriptional regulator AlpA